MFWGKVVELNTESIMQIGIITYHFGSNYGALLQTYALCNAVESLGHNVKIIDFTPEQYAKDASLIDTIKSGIVNIINYRNCQIRHNRIATFREKHFKLTDHRYTTVEDINNNPPVFDAYICGSDQIWNPELFGVLSPYFLEFVPNTDAMKLSYAASFGKEFLDASYKDLIGQYIRPIQYISVRETTGIDIVREVAGREAKQVLDPVFLIPPHEWETLPGHPFSGPSEYILLYTMEINDQILESVRYLAKRCHMQIIHLFWGIRKRQGIDHIINNAGPLEFIELIKNASYVCTNSFHGAAFSIIFNKPFLVVPHKSRNTRIASLLGKLELTSQMVTDNHSLYQLVERNLEYDANKATRLLRNAIDSSFDFLQKTIGGTRNCTKQDPG
jgi:polysaccharide pyruvyl transferase